MAKQVQKRRGTKAENEAFTGAVGEVIMETDTKNLCVHDGAKQGGHKLTKTDDIQAQTFTYGEAGGTADVLTFDTGRNPEALSAGLKATVKITADNTGAATFAWGSLAAQDIKTISNGSKVDVTAGALVDGTFVDLIYDGTDWILLSGGGGGGLIDYQVFTSSGTWTKPANANKLKVTVVGGGGGGGEFGAGSAGGTSSFGAHCSASGGGGGGGATTSDSAGGSGGSGSSGDINMTGGNGVGNTGADELSGDGGASFMGQAGTGEKQGTTSYSSGKAYGGGGGGGNRNGGSGGGGGGGGCAIKFISSGIGSTETVTIGGGGGIVGAAGTGASGVVIVESYS